MPRDAVASFVGYAPRHVSVVAGEWLLGLHHERLAVHVCAEDIAHRHAAEQHRCQGYAGRAVWGGSAGRVDLLDAGRRLLGADSWCCGMGRLACRAGASAEHIGGAPSGAYRPLDVGVLILIGGRHGVRVGAAGVRGVRRGRRPVPPYQQVDLRVGPLGHEVLLRRPCALILVPVRLPPEYGLREHGQPGSVVGRRVPLRPSLEARRMMLLEETVARRAQEVAGHQRGQP
mmetsp:Transcript_14279/g.41205  ORF Transcript_14279/g.41205 Transcript_14279/m.41205 type:complete len:230 (+) Transcript_14279:955-1644(+)